MIEILNRWTRTRLYVSETATTIAEAISGALKSRANLSGANLSEADLSRAELSGANLSEADLSGANLSGANLSRANLSGANLSRANLSMADLSRANLSMAYLSEADLSMAYLSRAELSGANLSEADLSRANLSGANLSRANLSMAEGINPYASTPLLMLLDQPGLIRAYKLVNECGLGPFNGGIMYEVGADFAVSDANTDVSVHCAAGINLATLDWCIKEWRNGYRILFAEFTAADIAAIPTGTDGKFRVHRCKIVGEVDLRKIGLLPQEQTEDAHGQH